MYVERTAYEVKATESRKRTYATGNTVTTTTISVGPCDGAAVLSMPLAPDEEIPRVGTRVVLIVKEDAHAEAQLP